MTDAYEASDGVMTAAEIASAMESASQSTGDWQTRWTVVYEYGGAAGGNIEVAYFWNGDYGQPTRVALP